MVKFGCGPWPLCGKNHDFQQVGTPGNTTKFPDHKKIHLLQQRRGGANQSAGNENN